MRPAVHFVKWVVVVVVTFTYLIGCGGQVSGWTREECSAAAELARRAYGISEYFLDLQAGYCCAGKLGSPECRPLRREV